MTLSACAPFNERSGARLQTIPPLSGDLAITPADPGVKVGDDARVALARHRQALAMCRAQYIDLRKHYERFSTPGPKKRG